MGRIGADLLLFSCFVFLQNKLLTPRWPEAPSSLEAKFTASPNTVYVNLFFVPNDPIKALSVEAPPILISLKNGKLCLFKMFFLYD